MRTTIRQMHRAMVDRLADTRWLRGRAGAQASWTHYERHARARNRAQRLAANGPPRVLARWQTAIARLLGQSTVTTPEMGTPPEGQGR
jgi:hypothetical protein